MRINDDRTPTYWLGQYGDTFDGMMICGFKGEPLAGKRILLLGPEQCAEEEQNGQNRNEAEDWPQKGANSAENSLCPSDGRGRLCAFLRLNHFRVFCSSFYYLIQMNLNRSKQREQSGAFRRELYPSSFPLSPSVESSQHSPIPTKSRKWMRWPA